MKIDTMRLIQILTAGSFIFLTQSAFAEKVPSFLCDSGSGNKDHCRASIRHIKGSGLGYEQGYTTVEGFFAPGPDQVRWMPFLDLRGHVFDKGYMAANAGMGLRAVRGDKVYGLNVYYDVRDTKKNQYNQVGLGFESLGKLRDFRVNGYLPIGNKTVTDLPEFSKFSGHNMILSQKSQVAMKGIDAAFGFHRKLSHGTPFYAAIGPYYYIGDIGSGAWGGKVRIQGGIGKYLTVEAIDSYDETFYNKVQLKFTFALPLKGSSRHPEDIGFSRSRMLQSAERQEIIVVNNHDDKSIAIDPVTHKPYYVVFVDNTSHSAGTFESPYSTLAIAQNNSSVGDIIYLFPGDGTTRGMDSGITLKNNQKLLGSGANLVIQTAQGNVTIPAHSATLPQITNTGAPGVTLAANNQLGGFAISEVFEENGIFGVNPGNIQMSFLSIDRSGADQIHLEYGASPGTVNLSHLTLTDGVLNGIFIDSTASSIVSVVDNSLFTGHGNGFVNASFIGLTDFRFTNNTAVGNDSSTFDFSGPSTLLISDNIVTNSTSPSSNAFSIITGASPVSATIENNIISDNVRGALYFVLNDTDAAHFTIADNTLNNNGSGTGGSLGSTIVIDANNTDSSNVQLRLDNNIISGNDRSAVYSSNGGYNDFSVTAIGNEMIDNGGAGFVFDNSMATFTLLATENTIVGGGDHGIATAAQMIDISNITLMNNEITGNNGQGGGVVLAHEGSTLNFTVTNNNLSDNEGTGISIYSAGGIENVYATIENNTISNNQNIGSNAAAGIDLEQFTNLSATITNNILSNNVVPGVYIGSTETAPTACVNMTGNENDTGYWLVNGVDGLFNLAPLNVETANTGEITLNGDIILVGSCS